MPLKVFLDASCDEHMRVPAVLANIAKESQTSGRMQPVLGSRLVKGVDNQSCRTDA